jgi:hypothetical protein
LESC